MSLNYTTFGGEVPKLHPRNLTNGYAALALDVDVSRGTLRAWNKDLLIDGTLKNQRNIMVEDCAVIASDRCIDVARATLPCKRYFRTGVAGYPEVAALPNGPWHRLGFPTLYKALSVDPWQRPEIDLTIPIGGGLIWTPGLPGFPGVPVPTRFPRRLPRTPEKVISRRYLYTIIDQFDQESQGSVPSDPWVMDWDEPVELTGFVIPAGVVVKAIKVYSTAPNLQSDDSPQASEDAFYEVAVLPPDTTVWRHYPTAAGFGDLYQNHNWYEPPTDLHSIQHWGTNQLAGLSGGRMLFSQPAAYHAWPTDYTIAFHSPALALVCSDRFGYALTCGHPEVIDLQHDCAGGKCHQTQRIEEQFPVISPRSAVGHDGSALYASTDGLVMLTGAKARLITSNLFTREQWLAIHPNTMVGAVHDGFYFGATDNYAFRMRIPDDAYEANPRNLLTQLSIRATAFYRSTTDRLYFADPDGVWEWNAGKGRKPFRWRGPLETTDRRRPMAAGEVLSDGNAVVRVWRQGRMVFERGVVGDTAIRLPTWVSGGDVQIEVQGTGEVSRLKLAGSKGQLAALT